jgi:hypothetical protein
MSSTEQARWSTQSLTATLKEPEQSLTATLKELAS